MIIVRGSGGGGVHNLPGKIFLAQGGRGKCNEVRRKVVGGKGLKVKAICGRGGRRPVKTLIARKRISHNCLRRGRKDVHKEEEKFRIRERRGESF